MIGVDQESATSPKDICIENEVEGPRNQLEVEKVIDNLKHAAAHTVEDIDEADPGKETQGENLNVRAAIIHMIGDAIQSLGVIVAAIIIYVKPTWTIADPICTFLFSVLVMITTVPIFCDCFKILMENAPEDVDVVEVLNDLHKVSF